MGILADLYEEAHKSTCLDKHVAATWIQNGHIKLIAHNETHCTCACNKHFNGNCYAIHAEQALVQEIKDKGLQNKIQPSDYVICTYQPCNECALALEEIGFDRCYYITPQTKAVKYTCKGMYIAQMEGITKQLNAAFAAVHTWHKEIKWPAPAYSNGAQTEQAYLMATALQQEAAELINTLHWKPWRPNYGKSPNLSDYTEELADVFFFFVSLCECYNISQEEMSIAIINKLGKNTNRETIKSK